MVPPPPPPVDPGAAGDARRVHFADGTSPGFGKGGGIGGKGGKGGGPSAVGGVSWGTYGRWTCATCGCRKNRPSRWLCKHCKTSRSEVETAEPPGSQGQWQAGAPPRLPLRSGPQFSLGPVSGPQQGQPAEGMSKGAPTTMSDLEKLATMLEQVGDTDAAARHRA
eukprot:8512718-Pyramimonas_sp.AAC.1